MSAEAEAKRLAALGYRRTSRRHNMLARVDRPDWKEAMAANHPQGMEWVNALGHSAPDYYRRVHSEDKIIVSPEVMKLALPSGHDPIGYVDPEAPSKEHQEDPAWGSW